MHINRNWKHYLKFKKILQQQNIESFVGVYELNLPPECVTPKGLEAKIKVAELLFQEVQHFGQEELPCCG